MVSRRGVQMGPRSPTLLRDAKALTSRIVGHEHQGRESAPVGAVRNGVTAGEVECGYSRRILEEEGGELRSRLIFSHCVGDRVGDTTL